MLENALLFFEALVVNLRIGLLALGVGLLIGGPLAIVRIRGSSLSRRTVGFLIGFLRAFPVYVLLFVALNLLESNGFFDLAEYDVASISLVIALSAYTVSACSDACLTFLAHRASGAIDQAWLVIPNVMQIFIITLVSTSLGAAIGVQEVVFFTINLADTFSERWERVALVLVVIVFFTVFGVLVKWLVLQVSGHMIGKNKQSPI